MAASAPACVHTGIIGPSQPTTEPHKLSILVSRGREIIVTMLAGMMNAMSASYIIEPKQDLQPPQFNSFRLF